MFGGLLLIPVAVAEVFEVIEQQGVSVTFSIEHATDTAVVKEPFREGEHVLVQFRAEDNNHSPLSGLYPAAWIHPAASNQAESSESCIDKTKAFIGGSLLSRAEIDLNVYYVLTLNQDASISVVDPLFGFGGSKLLAMLSLHANGFDWAVSATQDRVFVSLPATHEIAEINTSNWQVTHHASDGQWKKPTLVSLQSDQPYIWTLVENGVAVFDHHPFALKQVIATQNTPSAIEFSANGRFAYLLNQANLDVIDTRSLSIIKSIKLGDSPVSMDYASLAKELYISHAKSGEVWVLDGQKHEVIQVLQSEPGIGMLRFAPNGRWGFLLNPLTDRLFIIDAAKQKIVQTGRVEAGPESVTFSDQLAYIRHTGSSNLLMITLDDVDLGIEDAAIPDADTPGGDQSPGLIDIPSGAEGVVQAPGSNAVLVSNFRDKTVYFYKEGMAAPMGQFNNYGKSPRAVLAVDHSLRERETAGTYSTSTILPAEGHYQAVFFMDSPRLIHCFSFRVASALANNSVLQDKRIVITPIGEHGSLKTGKTAQLKFRAQMEAVDAPLQNEQFDVTILLSSGIWRQNSTAMSSNQGEIIVQFIPPLPGSYDIYLIPTNKSRTYIKRKLSYDVVREGRVGFIFHLLCVVEYNRYSCTTSDTNSTNIAKYRGHRSNR